MRAFFRIIFSASVGFLLMSCSDSSVSGPDFVIENIFHENDSIVFHKLSPPDLSSYESFLNEKFSKEEIDFFKSQISVEKEVALKPLLENNSQFKNHRLITSFEGIYDKTIYEYSYPLFNKDNTKAILEIRSTRLKSAITNRVSPLEGVFMLVVYELKDGKWVLTDTENIDIT